MDDSMGEDDSLISSTSWYPGQSNGPRPIPPSFSRADSSFSYPVRQATSAQPRQLLDFDDPRFADEELEPEEEEEEERGADGADEADEADEAEDDAEGSETSSAMFDAEADPEGFAKRLDELAGVLEKSEEEVRALKWGPPIGKGVKAMSMPVLAHDDFRALIDHHLNMTDWKYASNGLIPGQGLDGPTSLLQGLEGAAAEAHPVHVMIPDSSGDAMCNAHTGRMDEASVLGIEGLPGLPVSMSARSTEGSHPRHPDFAAPLVASTITSVQHNRWSARRLLLFSPPVASYKHAPILTDVDHRLSASPMRGFLFTQKIGLAIVVALALPRLKPIVGVRAAVIVRDTSPFLIGPPGDVVDPTTGGDDGDADVMSSAKVKADSKTTTSVDATSSASSSSMSESSASSKTITTSSSISSSSSPTPTPASEPSTKQPGNIRYLVPVFLLIFITITGWLFSKWYSKRKRERQDKDERDYERRNFQQLKDEDEDEKDPWYAGDDDPEEMRWQDVNLVPARSSGAISASGRGWGWRSTVDAWKSARGRAMDQGEDEFDEMGQRATIKLISPIPPAATYQTLPDLQGRPIGPIPEEGGSIRSFREKLASLGRRGNSPKKLGRNRVANKRRSTKSIAPPEPPAWIQPRATSPTQALSPPMQPHLFFHPFPSGQSIHGVLGTTGSESGSDYGSDNESNVSRVKPHHRFPTIPSSATALANSYTVVPARTPRKADSRGSTESVVDGDEGDARGPSRRRTELSRALTTPARASVAEPALRRSVATNDLANNPPSLLLRSATAAQPATSSRLSPRPKKTKSQKNADKAHDKVEDILKASWSDRALASPTSCMSLDGAVAATVFDAGMSPGVEEAAVFSGTGGGIEQRLALLRSMEV